MFSTWYLDTSSVGQRVGLFFFRGGKVVPSTNRTLSLEVFVNMLRGSSFWQVTITLLRKANIQARERAVHQGQMAFFFQDIPIRMEGPILSCLVPFRKDRLKPSQNSEPSSCNNFQGSDLLDQTYFFVILSRMYSRTFDVLLWFCHGLLKGEIVRFIFLCNWYFL